MTLVQSNGIPKKGCDSNSCIPPFMQFSFQEKCSQLHLKQFEEREFCYGIRLNICNRCKY